MDRFGAMGYEVLEGFLDQPCVDALRREVDVALRAPPMPGCERPNNRIAALRWDDPIVRIILTDAERCHALGRRIGATDLRWISGYVTAKDARSAPLWWHQDWWCWDHPVSMRPAAAQVALLCYLSDTTERTGALRVLPGSHHRSVPLHGALLDADKHEQRLPPDHPAISDQPGQVTVSVRAGDAVVLDYRLLHGTHANDAGERRDCVLLSFTPAWTRLPSDLRGHLVQHLALPSAEERPAARRLLPARLLPTFDGDLDEVEISVSAPAQFTVRIS